MRGDRLAELRKDAGLTQRQFAQQMHVSLNSVSGCERGVADPDDETKVLLAKRFGVSMDYLMGVSDAQKMCIRDRLRAMAPASTSASAFFISVLPFLLPPCGDGL